MAAYDNDADGYNDDDDPPQRTWLDIYTEAASHNERFQKFLYRQHARATPSADKLPPRKITLELV